MTGRVGGEGITRDTTRRTPETSDARRKTDETAVAAVRREKSNRGVSVTLTAVTAARAGQRPEVPRPISPPTHSRNAVRVKTVGVRPTENDAGNLSKTPVQLIISTCKFQHIQKHVSTTRNQTLLSD